MAILPSVGNMRNFRGINDNVAGSMAEMVKVRKKVRKQHHPGSIND